MFLWDPGDYHEILPWIPPEKVLWEDQNNTVDADRIVSVSGYPGVGHQGYTITGLEFIYGTGAARTIGPTNGQPTCTVALGAWTSIDRIEWFSDQNGVFEIVVGSYIQTLYALGS